MPPEKHSNIEAQPQTRHDLQDWIADHLHLPAHVERSLLAAIDAVFTRHEHLWQESKQEAIQALSAAFAERRERIFDDAAPVAALAEFLAHRGDR